MRGEDDSEVELSEAKLSKAKLREVKLRPLSEVKPSLRLS